MKRKIWKREVEVHKMEWLYPYVRLEDFMKVCKWLEKENEKLTEKVKRLEFDVDAWHQLKLLLEWEIEKLKEERDKYYAEWHLRHS